MECLDANVVQDLMAGALDGAARLTAVAHLDGCADCRALVSMLARAATHDAALATLSTTAPAGELALLATLAADDAAGGAAWTGQVLGRYAIGERLGAGAMGVVYRADDRDLGRPVAVKLLHRPDDALTERLVREARSMAQVNHPNVVAVYEVGVAQGATYIAMELVAGQSLRAWQARRSIAERVEAYIAAGRGLAAAHAAGIVHRDFKPDNCLVGADGRVRVTDFGLAAAQPGTAPPPSDLELTAEGSVLGTPAYMAPEQFVGGNVDPRTDQFSFCVALHEALYGVRPFAGRTFGELADEVGHGRVRPAPAGARVSGALRAIVLRGLSVRPGDRFPTLDHLLGELGRDRARPWRRTAIAAAATAAALGLGLVADLVVRDRVAAEIRESFVQTGRQTNRAWDALTGRFDAGANQVYALAVMREVSAHRDQADFGLGSPEADADNLDRIQAALASQDWTLVRDFAGKVYQSTIAVADYKGRMLYSTAAPGHPRTDLTRLPWVKAAMTQTDRSITLVRTDDPALAATGLLGPAPAPGLGLVYTRTLVLGSDATKEVASAFIEEVAAAGLLGEVRLDDRTRLSVVARDGTAIGDVPAALVRAADAAAAEQVERELDGRTYQVLAQPIRGFDGRPVGHVVMARALDGVLSLFPGARGVFALALIAALTTAAAAAAMARRITQA